MRKLLIIIAFIGFAFSINAQELNTHYLYQLNWLNINPAYTGETERMQAIINPGTQWMGMDGNPTNSMIGIHGALGDNIGLGGKVIMDKKGVFENLTAEMLYAYKVNLTSEQKLNFGISAGIYNTRLNQAIMLGDIYLDSSDPELYTGFYTETQLIGSFGAVYQFKGLDVGLSMPHMIVSGRPISSHVFGTLKYDFRVSRDKFIISPMFVYQNLPNSPNLMDLGARIGWAETVWTQATYRTNKTTSLALGVNIEKFNIGYLYNITSSALNLISNGSHEVFISFTFGKKPAEGKESDSNNPSRLNSDINDLKKIDINDSVVQEEIKTIQKELSELIDKIKAGTYTEADEIRIKELEERIKVLKTKYSK